MLEAIFLVVGVMTLLTGYLAVGWGLALYASRRAHRAYLECVEQRRIEGRPGRHYTCPGVQPAHDHHPDNRPNYNALILTWFYEWVRHLFQTFYDKANPDALGAATEEKRLEEKRAKALKVLIVPTLNGDDLKGAEDRPVEQDPKPKRLTLSGDHLSY